MQVNQKSFYVCCLRLQTLPLRRQSKYPGTHISQCDVYCSYNEATAGIMLHFWNTSSSCLLCKSLTSSLLHKLPLLSREVDPKGKRTVGVVTKVDLAEPGIKDRLEATGADHLRLELGYVAVCNFCTHVTCVVLKFKVQNFVDMH